MRTASTHGTPHEQSGMGAVTGRRMADEESEQDLLQGLRTGVLPAQCIRAFIERGLIKAEIPLDPGQIQPASLDLRLGARAWRVRASFLPGRGRRVLERLADFRMHEMDLTAGAVLEKGCVYLIPLVESLALPQGVSAVANAKSSTGRLDVLTRLVTDSGTEFDRVPAGYHGPLWAEICPRSFSILVRPGQRLNQIRFRMGNAVVSDQELAALQAAVGLVTGPGVEAVIDQGLAFSVDLRQHLDGPVGYRAKPHAGVVDLDAVGAHDPAEYWEPLQAPQGRLILDPGAFYILVSREAVHIPPAYAAEMAP